MKASSDSLERFERLAQLARAEEAPAVDVAGRVRRAVVARTRRVDLLPRWAYGLAGALGAVSCLVGWLGWQAWTVAADPLSGWLLSTVVS